MNTRRIWTKVTLFVALALASLSSTAVVAASSAPHWDGLTVWADHTEPVLCSESSADRFNQYLAAIERAEQGGPTGSLDLSVRCFEDSKTYFNQYQAAIESAKKDYTLLPDLSGVNSQTHFSQYQAAIEAAEKGWTVAPVLTGENSRVRFEQYQAAIESTR